MEHNKPLSQLQIVIDRGVWEFSQCYLCASASRWWNRSSLHEPADTGTQR